MLLIYQAVSDLGNMHLNFNLVEQVITSLKVELGKQQENIHQMQVMVTLH